MKIHVEFPKIQVYKQTLSICLCPVDAILTKEKHHLLVVLLFLGLSVTPLVLKDSVLSNAIIIAFFFPALCTSLLLSWGENEREIAKQQIYMVLTFNCSS